MKTLKDLGLKECSEGCEQCKEGCNNEFQSKAKDAAIEWIKTLQYVISQYEDIDGRRFTYDNFIDDLNKKGIDYKHLNRTVFKHDEGMNSDRLVIDGKALILHLFNITEEDLK